MKDTHFLIGLSDAESNCSKESIDPNDEVRKVMNHGEELIVITPTAHDEIGDEVAIAAAIYDYFLYAIRSITTDENYTISLVLFTSAMHSLHGGIGF